MFWKAFLFLAQVAAPPADARVWTHADFPRSESAALSYPADALRAGLEGRARVALKLDGAGVPVACWIVESSGAPSLDAASCEAMLVKARFTLKRDADGRPVEEVLVYPVRWELPE